MKPQNNNPSNNHTNAINNDVERFLGYAQRSLKNRKWEDASVFFYMALKKDPEEERAYIGLLCAEMEVTKEEDLANVGSRIKSSEHYEKACLYGGKEVRNRLDRYAGDADTEGEMTSAETKKRLLTQGYAQTSGSGQVQPLSPEEEKELRYLSALEEMQKATSSEDYKMLRKTFRNLGDYKDAPQKQEECARLEQETGEREYYDAIRNSKKGDTIRFGKYHWLVLSSENNDRLLLSMQIVAERTYSDSVPMKKKLFFGSVPKNVITWEDSDLRKWLNSEFLGGFSEEDQSMIRETTLTTPDNPDFRTKGGKKTKDLIFLLSLQEALEFGPEVIKYDVDKRPWWLKGVLHNELDDVKRWWLRTPGKCDESLRIAFARNTGELISEGEPWDHHLGVRPAMWIRVR